MSTRFGIPDHSPQTPEHALSNPTPQTPQMQEMSPQPDYNRMMDYYMAQAAPSADTYASSGPRFPRARRKSLFLAIFLAVIFGPWGLFYTSRVGAVVLTLFIAAAAYETGGINALGNEAVTKPLWFVATLCAIAWTIVNVIAHNRAATRAEEEATR